MSGDFSLCGICFCLCVILVVTPFQTKLQQIKDKSAGVSQSFRLVAFWLQSMLRA